MGMVIVFSLHLAAAMTGGAVVALLWKRQGESASVVVKYLLLCMMLILCAQTLAYLRLVSRLFGGSDTFIITILGCGCVVISLIPAMLYCTVQELFQTIIRRPVAIVFLCVPILICIASAVYFSRSGSLIAGIQNGIIVNLGLIWLITPLFGVMIIIRNRRIPVMSVMHKRLIIFGCVLMMSIPLISGSVVLISGKKAALVWTGAAWFLVFNSIILSGVLFFRSRVVSADYSDRMRDFGLTERESAVAGLVLRGESNRSIARILGISEETVKLHAHRIFRKTGVSSRMDLLSIFHRLR